MKRILPFSLVVITALILAACGGASAESPEQFESLKNRQQTPALVYPLPQWNASSSRTLTLPLLSRMLKDA